MPSMYETLHKSGSETLSKLNRNSIPSKAVWNSDDFTERDENGLPVPPQYLMQYGETPQQHLITGRRDSKTILDMIADHNVSGNVLDFGCSNGRVTRWLSPLANDHEVWGVDINGVTSVWAAIHLRPLMFLTMSTYGHLPFCDGFFSFAFAFSVFTHMDEHFTYWLQEMRRLIQPGGYMFLTVHDEIAVSYMRDLPQARKKWIGEVDDEDFVLNQGVFGINLSNNNLINTYIDRATLIALFERSFDVVNIVEKAYSDFQSGYLLRRI